MGMEGRTDSPHHPRIPELNVKSMCFLPPSSMPSSSSSPVLAILHIDSQLRRQIITRRIDVKEKEAALDDSLILPIPLFVDSDAEMLIPVNGASDGSSGKISKGGIIIVGGGSCQYLPCEEPKASSASTEKATKSSGKQKKTINFKTSPTTSNKRKRTRDNSTNSIAGENPGLKTDVPFHMASA